MSNLLKGNFAPQKQPTAPEPKKADLEGQFETEALKRLGGSIAFVSKRKVMWGLNHDKKKR